MKNLRGCEVLGSFFVVEQILKSYLVSKQKPCICMHIYIYPAALLSCWRQEWARHGFEILVVNNI